MSIDTYVGQEHYIVTIEGPRTRVGQPKMKYWKLHELHKNEVKTVHPICHLPKNVEI